MPDNTVEFNAPQSGYDVYSVGSKHRIFRKTFGGINPFAWIFYRIDIHLESDERTFTMFVSKTADVSGRSLAIMFSGVPNDHNVRVAERKLLKSIV